MNEKEIQMIKVLQGDLPVSERPFKETAEAAGISETELLEVLRRWIEDGTVRRFGAVVRHRTVGLESNGMSVWLVPEDEVDRVGRIISSFREVSHCYERRISEGWEYNLFAMIHGRTSEDVEKVAAQISAATGIDDYRILFSTKEYKKTSMKYFTEDGK